MRVPNRRSSLVNWRRTLVFLAISAFLAACVIATASAAVAGTAGVSSHAAVLKAKPKPKPKPKGGASAAELAMAKAEHCPAGKTILSGPNDQDADNLGGDDDFDGCL